MQDTNLAVLQSDEPGSLVDLHGKTLEPLQGHLPRDRFHVARDLLEQLDDDDFSFPASELLGHFDSHEATAENQDPSLAGGERCQCEMSDQRIAVLGSVTRYPARCAERAACIPAGPPPTTTKRSPTAEAGTTGWSS